MAIIKCPDCGKEISIEAKACPNCGKPINIKKISPILWAIMNFIFLFPGYIVLKEIYLAIGLLSLYIYLLIDSIEFLEKASKDSSGSEISILLSIIFQIFIAIDTYKKAKRHNENILKLTNVQVNTDSQDK